MKTWLAVAVVALSVGCGSDDGDAQNGKSCTHNNECGDGYVCLTFGNDGGCAPICTGDADACGASAQCGGVGVMSVDVCQPKQEESPSQEPPDAEEQPRIPCSSDKECKVYDSGAICAEFQGQKDCTLPCTTESQCDMPSLGGVTMDFLTCIADEGQSSRKACLPDLACFQNPMNCVTFDSGFEDGFDDGFDFD